MDGEGYTEGLRRAAAAAQDLRARQAQLAEALERLEELGLDTSLMVDRCHRAERFMEQLGSVHAAQALAYEAMMAAGGPDNSRAYVEYEAATRRNIALLPQESLGD